MKDKSAILTILIPKKNRRSRIIMDFETKQWFAVFFEERGDESVMGLVLPVTNSLTAPPWMNT